MPSPPLTKGQLTIQKWEAKLLQSRVADFARAPEAGEGEDDDDSDDNGPSRAGPSSRTQAAPAAPPHNPYGYSGAPATIQNGYNQQYQQTTQQYNPGLALPGMVNVKTEPDMPIRPRGGAVSYPLFDDRSS
jgi:transcription initiation factor TFIIA large subunit